MSACAQPYEPWFSAYTYPTPAVVPDLGDSIAFDVGPPDTDGDGKPDGIASGSNSKVEITRGDGVVTLLPGKQHKYIGLASAGPQAGDLDGDGRDEVIIGVEQGQQYLLAPGPGGTAPVPAAIAEYSGENLIAAPLKPGATPTIITGSRYPSTTNLTVHASPPLELIARDVLREYTGGPGKIDAYSKGGQAFVTVSASDRSGSSIAIWNVDDPCSRFAAQPAPATPSAPTPAKPVAGSPDFTG